LKPINYICIHSKGTAKEEDQDEGGNEEHGKKVRKRVFGETELVGDV
jgi:hypothetical protein